MIAQLPALQVVVPLICAALSVVSRSRRVAWLLFLLAALSSLAFAVLLAVRVSRTGTLRYEMDGWPAPAGIEWIVGGYNVPVLLLVSGIAVAVAVYGERAAGLELDDWHTTLLYTFLCLTLSGLLGLSITGDIFNAFVFLEISSLSTYALVALGRRRLALLSSFRYLVIGTVGATFFVIGIGLAYAVTGTLNMADLADRVTAAEGNRALYAAVVFVAVGLSVKVALVPLHAWLPSAYAEAPNVVSMFLAATSTKVAIYLLARVMFTVFGTALVFTTLPMGQVGLVLASVAMVLGSAVACFQGDLKYVLAWSSVAQIGYIIAGISLATAAGVSAGYLHMINHAITKAALFAAAGLLLARLGSVQFGALVGLGRRMPWTFGAIVVAGIGLIGLPPTAGFVSKWALVNALVEQQQWFVLVAVLVSSLLALVYIGRVVEVAWFREPAPVTEAAPPPVTMVVATWALVLLSVYFGIDASLPASLADSAAQALTGGGR
jgi:multicomponent Na+:H+ antiporter subunit D